MDKTSSEASLRAKCLIMSDLQIPHSELKEKVTYITTNQKKNTNGPILLSSISLYLCCSFSSCSLSLSFCSPSVASVLFLRQRLGELSSLIKMRKVVCWSFFFAGLCSYAHSMHLYVIYSILLKWYDRHRGEVR